MTQHVIVATVAESVMEKSAAFICCSLLTTFGSIAAAGMEFIAFLGTGWDSVPFDCLLGITILSTLGLITGTVGLLTRRVWPTVVLIASSIYMPVALVLLTMGGYAPPGAWWLLLPVSLVEITVGWRAMTAARRTAFIAE